MEIYFDHEKLKVYQDAIEFIKWSELILEKIPKKLSVWGQIDKASTSIPLNIAEGNGKFTPRDRCHYFDIARGSALECAAAIDVIVAKKYFTKEQVHDGKIILKSIVSMIIGLIKKISSDRAF